MDLRERLERHARDAFATNRLVELLSFLLAYGGRPLAADQFSRLLWLAERDQLSTHRVNRLSRAVRVRQERGAASGVDSSGSRFKCVLVSVE